MANFDFNLPVNIKKSENDDYFEFSGLASTEDEDLQGEIVKQNFDLSAIEEGKGVVNCDHGHKYDNKDHARIGVIDEAKITKNGLWMKGKIWKKHPEAIAYYNEMKYKPGMVNLSVEGYSIARNPFNDNVIDRAVVTGVALTRNPVNKNTYASIIKSLMTERPAKPVVDYEVIQNKEKVKIIQTVNPNSPEFKKYMSEFEKSMDSYIEKGGPGSGRKKEFGKDDEPENEEKKEKQQEKVADSKEVIVEQDNEKKEKEGTEEVAKEEGIKQEQEATESKEKKPKQSQYIQYREALKREKKEAREQGKTREEIKENLQNIAKKYTSKLTSKRKFKKSEIIDELVRRSNKSPDFRKRVEELLKALTSGGPAYSTTLPKDFSGGQVFQQESIVGVTDKKKKKKKKKDEN